MNLRIPFCMRVSCLCVLKLSCAIYVVLVLYLILIRMIWSFTQKSMFCHMSFYHDFLHYTIVSTCNVLIPNILYISKGVGGIWEECRSEGWIGIFSQARAGISSLDLRTSWCLDYFIKSIVIDLAIFYSLKYGLCPNIFVCLRWRLWDWAFHYVFL